MHSPREYLAYFVECEDDTIQAFYDPGKAVVSKFKQSIATRFRCKDLGAAHSLLGFEIDTKINCGITLSRQAYAIRLLERFNMANCNGRATPLDAGHPHHHRRIVRRVTMIRIEDGARLDDN